jgi:predicted nucleic acid-binding protein
MSMLVDTDILVWYLRGSLAASRALDEVSGFSISAVTYTELLQGLRNKGELAALRRSLDSRRTTILPVTAAITTRAVALMEVFVLSHGLRMGDALIASTALEHGLGILTGNVKHYVPVEGLSLNRFFPDQ